MKVLPGRSPKARIAVVTPFLDKRHGTERCIAEQIERWRHDYEIHIYSMRVADVDLTDGSITWHRIPGLPGPLLLTYPWWFVTNHLWRWWDRRVKGLECDLVYSPGINCFDADVIAVHIVFAEFYRRVEAELRLRRNPLRFWPRLLHRRLYYHLIMALERRIYSNPRAMLAAVARKTSRELHHFFGRKDNIPVVYNGIDPTLFNPEARWQRRTGARSQLGLDSEFALLLIGNDWKKKGLRCLLEAMARISDRLLVLLVVGRDDRAAFDPILLRLGVEGQVRFLKPSPDVLQFYAAADLYVGPSLDDSFAIPPLEAMACGLPVIVSRQNGTFEVLTDGHDGFILESPADSSELAEKIARLYRDPELRQRLGNNASATAAQYTWDRNAKEMARLIQSVLESSGGFAHGRNEILGSGS